MARIVPVQTGIDILAHYPSAIPLAFYPQIVEPLDECAFFGVRVDSSDSMHDGGCDDLWSQYERKRVARYLNEAQVEIEQVVNFPLQPRWITETLPLNMSNSRYALGYRYPTKMLHTRWTRLIEVGQKAVEDIQLGATVNHATDPAVITILGVSASLNVDQVEVFFEDKNVEISPSSVSLSGTTLTIEVPRCRLKKPSLDYLEVAYSDTANFVDAVDVKRVYSDTAVQAVLHCKPTECGSCTGSTQNACIYVEDHKTGFVSFETTDGVLCNCCRPKMITLYYKAGLDEVNADNPIFELTTQAQDAVVRLAHAKMPMSPCGCDSLMNIWMRDRGTPSQLTVERANNPFGEASYGSWVAFRWAMMMRSVREQTF